MGNIAIRTKETIVLNRGDVVWARFPSKEQLAVIIQAVRAWSKTATVVVTPLEKMDDGSGDSDAIYVGENSYVALWRHALRCRSKDKLPPMEIEGSTEKKRWKEYEAVKMSRARWKSIGNMES